MTAEKRFGKTKDRQTHIAKNTKYKNRQTALPGFLLRYPGTQYYCTPQGMSLSFLLTSLTNIAKISRTSHYELPLSSYLPGLHSQRGFLVRKIQTQNSQTSNPEIDEGPFVGSLEADLERMLLSCPSYSEFTAELRCLIISHTDLVANTRDYEGVSIDLLFAGPCEFGRAWGSCHCDHDFPIQDHIGTTTCVEYEPYLKEFRRIEGVAFVVQYGLCVFCKRKALIRMGFLVSRETLGKRR